MNNAFAVVMILSRGRCMLIVMEEAVFLIHHFNKLFDQSFIVKG